MTNNNNRNYKHLSDALNDCIEGMLIKNEDIDTCLSRYPEHAVELKPLMETLKMARKVNSLTPEPEFRSRARYEFRSAIYDAMTPKKRTAMAWRWRWATIASTAGVFLLSSTGGAVAASSSSMPGQTLYSVKRAIENAQVTLTPSTTAKARLYATLADRRVGEIVFAATNDDAQLTLKLTDEFTQSLNLVSANALPARNLTFGNGAKQAGTSSIDNSAPEPTVTVTGASPTVPSATRTAPPTSSAPIPPGIVGSVPAITASQQAPSITLCAQSPTAVNLSGITDPALLKLLQQYSVKNVSELMSILDKVSPEVKTALLSAIDFATSGYWQLLNS